MLRYPILFLLFHFSCAVSGQFALVPGNTLDYGQVDVWRNQPGQLQIVNTGNRPLAILKISGSANLTAEYPKNFIPPGDTATLIFRLYTPHSGIFTEQADLFLSASEKPMRITVKGNIKSIASDALTACPVLGLQGPPPPFLPSQQRFTALDQETDRAIPASRFTLISYSGYRDDFKTPGNGKAVTKNYRTGEYALSVHADGYLPIDSGLLILPGEHEFRFYLKKPKPTVTEPKPLPEPEPEPQPQLTQITPDTTKTETGGSSIMPLEKFKPNNLVFVLDVSSSMRILGRMELLKKAMIQLTEALREADRITLITFSTAPVLRIKGVPGNQKDTLNGIIRSLSAAGATYGIRGLRYAYELAEKNFISEGNNTVIIATDGEFPQTDEHGTDIQTLIRDYLEKNIKLGVMAFGRDAEALKSMEKMAAKGAGGYMRMDGAESSPKQLLLEIMKQSER
jgi:hypothetical protein